MSQKLTPQKQFEQKIIEKMRADIGNLLPDSVLASLIEKATEEVFFKKEMYSSGWKTEYKDSWFVKEVKEIYKQKISNKADEYVQQHSKELEAAFLEIFKTTLPDMIVAFLVGSLTNKINSAGNSVSNSLVNRVNDALRSNNAVAFV